MPGPAPTLVPAVARSAADYHQHYHILISLGIYGFFSRHVKQNPAPALARAGTKVVSFSVVSRNCHPNIHNNINIQFLHQPPGDHSHSNQSRALMIILIDNNV